MIDFKKLEAACKAAGISEVEVYRITAEGASVSTFNGEVDQNVVSLRDEVFVRGVFGGHIASLYVENDCDGEIESIVCRIKENAEVIESNDPYFIFGGSKTYPTLPEEKNDYDKWSQADRIELCRTMEKRAREASEFVVSTQAAVEVETETVTIENSSGLSVRRSGADAGVVCGAVIRKDGDVKQGYYFDHLKNLADVDYEKLCEKAVLRPISSIGAKSIPSGKYPVVFENTQFISLLGCFASMFSADAVIKKLSLLDGKLGEKVFGDNITLIDDPQHEKSYQRVTFDDEGVAAFPKTVVEGGVLKTYLHNLKTAKMLGAESTGNGFKESSGGIGVLPTNLCLKPSDTSFDDMISDIENGVLITQMMGQHAGVNPVSGAFNLQASGFRIVNGKVADPVTLIVVSGNIIEVLNSVECIANDFEIARRVGSASVKIRELSISGQ